MTAMKPTKTTISRRSFLVKSAAAGVGAGLITQPFQIFAQGAPSRKITVAIMGIRSRGQQVAPGHLLVSLEPLESDSREAK